MSMEFYWIGNTGIRVEKDEIEIVGDKKMNKKFLELMEGKGIKYTKQQIEAVFHKDGPALVLAVPGSGKTTTIIGRVGNLILNYNVNPMNILAITFSRASALDMNSRFKSLFGDVIKQEVKFSTIHAFANMIVNSYNKRFNKNLALLKSWQINLMIEAIYKDIFKEDITEEDLDAYVTGISYIKNKMLSDKEVAQYEIDSELKKIGIILKQYNQLKIEKNYYDYDDMLELCLKILKENKVTLDFLREKYKYVLVDEGQDTSKLQYEIIKLLVAPKNNIYIVADDDQTIYKFRGVSPELLLNINDIFKNTKIYFMEQNFRSTKAIIEVANKVITNNSERYEKTIFTEKNKGCDSVELVYLDNVHQQNEYLINSIRGSSNDIALLYRNNLSAIPVANALYSKGINFCINNFKASFFNHWIVKDIMQIINLINNPADTEALANIYYKIKTYLNKNMIMQLMNTDIKGIDVFEYLLNNFKLKEHEYDRILTLKICFNDARQKSVYQGIRDLLYQIYYLEYIDKKKEKSSMYDEVISAVIEILVDVKEYSEANNRILELKKTMEESSKNNGCKVFLSTLHGSKGLEFTEVYLLNIIDSVIPSMKKDSKFFNEEEAEDDRRLFYVGITRAKEKLKILVPGQECSIFVDELLNKKINEEYLSICFKTTKTINYNMKLKAEAERKQKQIENYENNLLNIDDLKEGAKVLHKTAGKFMTPKKGIVIQIDGDKIQIELEGLGKKTYSLEILLRRDTLRILSEEEFEKMNMKE